MKKKVLIINTGGTISSVKTNKGFSPKNGHITKALSEIVELSHIEMPAYYVIEFNPLIDSSDINLANWNQLASTINEHYMNYDGFVILHGTDTMAYTASALSFTLENLSKPVIITGSQIPITELRSDAKDNIVTALYLAQSDKLNEVCIYFDQNLLRGNRSQKVSAYEFSAFDSPNFPPLAKVGTKVNWQSSLLLSKPTQPFNTVMLEQRFIANFRLFPSFSTEVVNYLLKQPIKGLVLETYGSGNAQSSDPTFINALANASKNGVIIVNCSQCHHGMVNMDTYATGQTLKNAGVISGYNMTAEAAHCKLLYLLSKYQCKSTIRQKLMLSLKGELNNEPGSLSS